MSVAAARPSAKVQANVAKLQGSLKDELARTPASAIAEAEFDEHGRAVARAVLAPGD